MEILRRDRHNLEDHELNPRAFEERHGRKPTAEEMRISEWFFQHHREALRPLMARAHTRNSLTFWTAVVGGAAWWWFA